MNKFFKPYLYFVYSLGVLAFILSYFLTTSMGLNISLMITTLFMIISEVKSISLSENSNFSLLGIIAIFSLTITTLFSSILSLIVALTIVNIIRVYVYKFYDKVINVKVLFNLSMHVFCLFFSYIISFNLFENKILSILSGILIYNFINKLMVSIILKLTNGKVLSMKITKDELSMFYYYILISFMLFYSTKAYGNLGLLFTLLFIISYQTTALNQNYKEEIKKSIYYDNLTNAHNRTNLNNIIEDKLLNKIPFSLLFLDLDNFKEINDKFSHAVGDKVLINFVQTIQRELNIPIYRYGGDEFCLLLKNDHSRDEIIFHLNNLKKSLVIDTHKGPLKYSFSIGKYIYEGNKMTLEEVFNVTSKNMHENKIEKRKYNN